MNHNDLDSYMFYHDRDHIRRAAEWRDEQGTYDGQERPWVNREPCKTCGSSQRLMKGAFHGDPRLSAWVCVNTCCSRYMKTGSNLIGSTAQFEKFGANDNAFFAAYNAANAASAKTSTNPQPKNAEKKKEITEMATVTGSTNRDLVSTFKADATEAAWRSAASTAVDLVRKPLAAGLEARLDSDTAKAASKFLNTPEGEAFLAVLLGSAPLFVDGLNKDPRVVKLAGEMRVQGISVVTDRVLKDLAGPIVEAFTKAVAGLPELPAKQA